MQNNLRATTALIMKEHSHILYQIKQQKLGYNVYKTFIYFYMIQTQPKHYPNKQLNIKLCESP